MEYKICSKFLFASKPYLRHRQIKTGKPSVVNISKSVKFSNGTQNTKLSMILRKEEDSHLHYFLKPYKQNDGDNNLSKYVDESTRLTTVNINLQ